MVLVVGLGSIGRRHVRNLKQIYPESQVVVWSRSHRAGDLEDMSLLVDRVVTSLDDALTGRPNMALLTNPASIHVETGLKLASHGIHLFVEKPLSNSMDGVDALLRLCEQRHVVLTVGYPFRFYPPLQAMRRALNEGRIGRVMTVWAEVGQYLPQWRPDTDYRESVSAKQELGGGVVLELSHELDYLRWMMGEVESVSAQTGRVSDLEIDVEDSADIHLRFASGAMGSVHLDMVQQPMTRTCRIIGTDGTLSWDWATHQVRLYSNQSSDWSDVYPQQDIDPNQMYVSELEHFMDCVEGEVEPEVSGEDARRTLEVALAAKRSSQEQKAVAV